MSSLYLECRMPFYAKILKKKHCNQFYVFMCMYLKDLPLTARCLGLIAKGPQWKSGSQGLSWGLNPRATVYT